QHYSFFFSSRRRHTRFSRDWSSDVCSSDLTSDTINVPADDISPPPVDSRQIPPDGTPCARVRFLHLLPVVADSIRALPPPPRSGKRGHLPVTPQNSGARGRAIECAPLM